MTGGFLLWYNSLYMDKCGVTTTKDKGVSIYFNSCKGEVIGSFGFPQKTGSQQVAQLGFILLFTIIVLAIFKSIIKEARPTRRPHKVDKL